jgi:hypothetical protein
MTSHLALKGYLPAVSCTGLQRSQSPGLDAGRSVRVLREVNGAASPRIKERRVMTDEDFARRNRNEESTT